MLHHRFGVLPVTKDEHAMAVEKVRHMGDLVACVCAETEAIAIEALSLFEIEWEILEPVFDRKMGLEDVDEQFIGEVNTICQRPMCRRECSRIWRPLSCRQSPRFITWKVEYGRSPSRIYRTTCCVAHWDPNGRLQLYTPQQVPHYTHRALSTVLDVPMHQINVVRTFVGGGFGGKSDPFPHEMCAAILARKSGRPVRITFDREEVYWINMR